MQTIALDVHADLCQMAIMTKDGEIVLEMQVQTRPEELRRAVAGVPGPKRVVFRDTARTILFTACAIMRTRKEYDDGRVNVPEDRGVAE